MRTFTQAAIEAVSAGCPLSSVRRAVVDNGYDDVGGVQRARGRALVYAASGWWRPTLLSAGWSSEGDELVVEVSRTPAYDSREPERLDALRAQEPSA